MKLTPAELSSRLANEPLLFAQVVTDNNPEAVSQKLMEEGIINGTAQNPELLDVILQTAPQMKPDQLAFIFDVPFGFNPENPASDAGFLETFSRVADKRGFTTEQATWSELFPEAAASIGEAQVDFTKGIETALVPSTQVYGHGRCQACAIRRLKNLLYLGIALMLIIILIKKW